MEFAFLGLHSELHKNSPKKFIRIRLLCNEFIEVTKNKNASLIAFIETYYLKVLYQTFINTIKPKVTSS